MSFLSRLFGRKDPPPTLEHPRFGRLTYSRHDGWRNPEFELWGQTGLELLIDAPQSGPTPPQNEAFQRFENSRHTLLKRCLDALSQMRHDMELTDGEFRITGLTIPALSDARDVMLWTLWFDCEGDDDFWYGVQSDDDWETISPFADD